MDRPSALPTDRPDAAPLRGTAVLWISLGLFLSVLAAYGLGEHGALQHAFVDFDDHQYVTEHPILDGRLGTDDWRFAWTKTTASNWAPVTSLSIALSDAIHGPNPGAYAATNVLVHALAGVLLFLALLRLTNQIAPAAWVAGVFALHPLHVESVVWISQRKEVLAGLFWIAALLAYAHARTTPTRTEPPSSEAPLTGRRRGAWMLVVLAAALAMGAKATAVVLPLSLLLIDFWPLDRLDSKRAVLRAATEKWPLILLAGGVSGATLIAQTETGANVSDTLPVGVRSLNALRSVFIYVSQSLWPSGLAAYYPYPDHADLVRPATLMKVGGVAGLTAAAIGLRRVLPAVTMGWFWFGVTLVPVAGLVQVGGQAHADRYTYMAQTGLAIAVAFGLQQARRTASVGALLRLPAARAAAAVLAGASLLAMAAATHRQVAVWQNSETLFSHAVRVTKDNHFAHRFLGVALWNRGDLRSGEAHLREALRLRPDWGAARLVLATALLQSGRPKEAAPLLDPALSSNAEPAPLWAARGVLSTMLGDEFAAAAAYERSVALDPDDWEVRNNLAWIRAASPHAELRDVEAALVHSAAALAQNTGDPWVLGTRAGALAAAGRSEEAAAHQARAIAALERTGPRDPLPEFRKRLEHYRRGGQPASLR